MQNNSNDNIQNWKQRLEDYEETESVDLHASWQKLQQKTPVVKTSSKKAWYWLAAACITVLSFLFIHNREAAPRTMPLVKTDTIKQQPGIKTLLTKNELLVVDQDKTITTTARKAAPKPLQVVSKEEKPLPLLISQTTEIKPPVELFDSGSRELTKLMPPVKKLKQVHINELSSTPGNNAFTQQDGKPYYPISYKAKEVYGGNVNANGSGKDRDHLIKIKIFP